MRQMTEKTMRQANGGATYKVLLWNGSGWDYAYKGRNWRTALNIYNMYKSWGYERTGEVWKNF